MVQEVFDVFKEKVVKRLASLNYEIKDTDEFVLKYVIDKVEQGIKNKTNLSEVPEGLHFVLYDGHARILWWKSTKA